LRISLQGQQNQETTMYYEFAFHILLLKISNYYLKTRTE
jgi:hypothetical protein